VVATTLTRNVVEGSGATVSDEGGGIHADSGTTTLQASILAGNTAPTKADGPNCAKFPTFQSAGHNLIGTTSGCVFAKQSTDKVNVANPGLGPLAHNGGPTETIALTAASPARNAFVPPCTVTTDQRGVHRPQGPRCDIGAFERS
jgi:fibronectin-binding autotransporter adhesin